MSLAELEGRPIRVTTWARTDVGRERKENQDNFLLIELPHEGDGSPFVLDPEKASANERGSWEFELGIRGALMLVADGMGGAAGGATASREAVARIREAFVDEWSRERERTPTVFARHLVRAVEDTNTQLHSIASDRPEFEGMGTTLTAAGLLDDFVYLAQVGDSRAYLIRDSEAIQLTRDQSMVQELVDTGAMTVEQARRSHQRNVILQALGTAPTVEVDLTYQQVRRGDALILCSDGLSGEVEAVELVDHAERFPDPAELCQSLIDLANERGGPDNITVAVARFDGPGLRVAADGEGVGHQPFPLSEDH